MSARFRKIMFTAHIMFSIGWLGAVIAYLALAIVGFNTQEDSITRSVYPSLELIGWYVIIPLCFAAIVTGIAQALITPWGSFKHYWIVAKLGLTAVATAILLKHAPTISLVANKVRESQDLGIYKTQLLIHAAGGLVILIIITIISVFKPWGRIRQSETVF